MRKNVFIQKFWFLDNLFYLICFQQISVILNGNYNKEVCLFILKVTRKQIVYLLYQVRRSYKILSKNNLEYRHKKSIL